MDPAYIPARQDSQMHLVLLVHEDTLLLLDQHIIVETGALHMDYNIPATKQADIDIEDTNK